MSADDPLDGLQDIWRWLPVFLAVAEVESVSRAADRLGLNPSSVSRAIRVIEEVLGGQVFDRVGRTLLLNPRGRRLLEAVQVGTKAVREVLGESGGDVIAGTVRLATMGQLDRIFLLPALKRLRAQAPRVRLSIRHLAADQAMDALSAGAIDLFLAVNLAVGRDFSTLRIGDLSFSVYAGRGHPLFGREGVDAEELAQHLFVAQERPALIQSVWPSQLQRNMGLVCDSHAFALDACLAGQYLVFMEDLMVRRHVVEQRLCRVDVGAVAPGRLSLVHHVRSLDEARVRTCAQIIVDEAQKRLNAENPEAVDTFD